MENWRKNNMSLSKTSDLYQKMLKNPENRKRSYMNQPMPGNAELGGAESPVPKTAIDEDESWIREVDQRVSAKKSGTPMTPVVNETAEKRILLLEERIKGLEELMTTIMKTQMKLIGK